MNAFVTAEQGYLERLHELVTPDNVNTFVGGPDGGTHGQTLLHHACVTGQERVVKWLIANGTHLNAQDWNERTSLHICVTRNQVRCLQILIDAGADTTIRKGPGVAPLHWCYNSYDCALTLIRATPNGVNIMDDGGFTPTSLRC